MGTATKPVSVSSSSYAPADFNRWLIPICAVLIQISIGSVYAWSTFNRPINALFPPAAGFVAWFQAPYITFSAALVLLGYIAPVSTLVNWFPDRRGMAIMGFGAGAFLAGYLNAFLIERLGVANSLFVLAAVYFVLMNVSARLIHRPAPGWRPHGWTPKAIAAQIAPEASITRNAALRTPQFWLLWGMLFLNVTAGIGILAQASPMMQDMFGRTALQAAAVVSLISIFNAGGRFVWASLSDYIGRRMTYLIFFALGFALFVTIPKIGAAGDLILFEVALCIVFRMYGGASPPSRHSWRICSGQATWAPFTERC